MYFYSTTSLHFLQEKREWDSNQPLVVGKRREEGYQQSVSIASRARSYRR